jgi:murein DD-endopeptidase MepM/ murein hydrolase activator NlpD
LDTKHYAHLSKYKARAGQRVKRGDVIGYVGSRRLHLHYEVLKDKKVVNQFLLRNISAVEYVVIAQLANQENQSLD